ncbi:MAG: hypothetical protein HFH46_00415 [Bacilli bacterium]|nr:hypothetical protein [Bacilli bacterium]
MICLLFIMTVGYAAFQTNLSISAKGNIKEKAITPQELKKDIVTTGDGLYEDTTAEGRSLYKGTNPNNYIKFNGELYRIIGIDLNGTMKIIKNESINSMAWDEPGTRDNINSTYCTNASTNGCNFWIATTNLVNPVSNFILYAPNSNPNTDTITYSGTITNDASLNTYLNTTYYQKLGEDEKYIINYAFNVGSPGDINDTETIGADIKQENQYKWNGKIGLMNVTDALKSTTNTNCDSLNAAFKSNTTKNCNTNNWLWTKSGAEWTMSPCIGSTRSYVFAIHSDGYIPNMLARSTNQVRPVFHLSPNISLFGKGTEQNPYTIK